MFSASAIALPLTIPLTFLAEILGVLAVRVVHRIVAQLLLGFRWPLGEHLEDLVLLVFAS